MDEHQSTTLSIAAGVVGIVAIFLSLGNCAIQTDNDHIAADVNKTAMHEGYIQKRIKRENSDHYDVLWVKPEVTNVD